MAEERFAGTIHPSLLVTINRVSVTHQHYKGGTYIYIGTGRWSGNDANEGRPVAVYWSIKQQQICLRFEDQFDEHVSLPRFEPLAPNAKGMDPNSRGFAEPAGPSPTKGF